MVRDAQETSAAWSGSPLVAVRKEIAEQVQRLGELQEVVAGRLLETLQAVETQVLSDADGTTEAKYARAALDCQIDAMLNMVNYLTASFSLNMYNSQLFNR